MSRKKKKPDAKDAAAAKVQGDAQAEAAEETAAAPRENGEETGEAPPEVTGAEAPEAANDAAPADAPEAEDGAVPAEEGEGEEAERREVAELKDQLLRAVAETENVRRRAAREREETGKYAITGFARELLSVLDNLRRALDSLTHEMRTDESLAGLISGIEMTERELLAAFERHGIRRIDPLGEKFDHNLHQAMFEVETSDQPAGTVVEVMQAGYVIADRLLRPAMVGVAKEEANEAEDAGDEAQIDTEA